MTRAADLDSRDVRALRRAAAALAAQNGRGVPRRVFVELAGVGARREVSVLAEDPVLALVGPRAGAALSSLLTPREREVAALIARGRSNREIAGELVISVATVKDHVHHILAKSGLPNRAAIAAEWSGG